jgi:pyruvate formate lyase activating enzyme
MSSIKETFPLEAKSPFELRLDMGGNVSESAVKTALATGWIGFIHSFTTGSAVDGPGIRLVGWTAGCHWRCLFCHNPDTWNMMNGMPVTLERATQELRKYRHGLKIMGGGFTLSGGEPLMQDRFVVRLFTAAHEIGVHTALNTNGALHARLSDQDLEKVDLVIMDVKAWDSERHRHLTGKDVDLTLDFARRLAARKKPLWLRFVLVPGLTDNDRDISEIAKFAAELGNVEQVQVLPFHQLGRFKWKALGLDYKLETTRPPTLEQVMHTCELFRSVGLTAH